MNTEQHIQQTLIGFWAAMFDWETRCNEYVDKDQNPPDEVYYDGLSAIYSQNVLPKERKMGRLQNMSVMFPPTFDPGKEIIQSIEVKGNTATVITIGTLVNLPLSRNYKLKKVADQWLIDNVKEWDAYDEKWGSIHI